MPSRKIIAIFIVCAALVASVILASDKKGTVGALKQGILMESTGTVKNVPDNPDWKADLSPLTLKNTEIVEVDSKTTNLTEKVSQSLIANYLSLRQSGNLNNTSAQSLIDQSIDFTEAAQGTVGKVYTTADIVVSSDNSKEAVRIYGSEMGNAIKINTPSRAINEITLFSQILQDKDKTRVQEMKDIAKVYRNIKNSFLNIKVPSSYAGSQLVLLNSMEQIATSIDSMALIFDDPLRSMSGISSYQSGYGNFMLSLNKIRKQVLQDGVVYKQGESGYYLYYGL